MRYCILSLGGVLPRLVLIFAFQDLPIEANFFLAALAFSAYLSFWGSGRNVVANKDLSKPSTSWELSKPIFHLSKFDIWTLADCCAGIFVSGTTGSGKTTGPGYLIAKSYLLAGFGGVILCVKADEAAWWRRMSGETGREDDFIVIDASGKHRYSFLAEEFSRVGSHARHTENVVNLFTVILEAIDRNGSQSGGSSEPYWQRAVQQLLRNAVDLLVLAQEPVTIPNLYRLITSIASSFDQLHNEDWQHRSYCFQCLAKADAKEKTVTETEDFRLVVDYFTNEFVQLNDRTRTSIVSSFTSLADVMNRGLLRTLFSSETTVRPEDASAGKIIVVDVSVKEHLEIGLIANILMKYCFQRAVERRHINDETRPVFLWADEAQAVTTSNDMLFQTTARSSKCATVLLSQSVSTMRAAYGGTERGETQVDSLLGNLQTQIFCASGDPIHSHWAADHFGRSRQLFVNVNNSAADDWPGIFPGHGTGQHSAGISEVMEHDVPPQTFTLLRTGGPKNDWQIDAMVFQGGRVFQATGANWLPVTFQQPH